MWNCEFYLPHLYCLLTLMAKLCILRCVPVKITQESVNQNVRDEHHIPEYLNHGVQTWLTISWMHPHAGYLTSRKHEGLFQNESLRFK